MDDTLALDGIISGMTAPMYDDDVSRAQGGDLDAFERLYRGHVGRVYALCLRLTSDRHAAEELTQDAFVRAWERIGSFRGQSAFSTWLHRLTVNVVYSAHRSNSRRDERVTSVEDLEVYSPTARPARPSERMDLDDAIAKLPSGARRIFVLHDVEGFQHDEIASMTGLAVGTSKAQLHRARRMLQEMLAL
jgi:RNA polymerase sigma-70 factor (ECF subfamily)